MTHTKDEVVAAQGLVEALLRFAAAVEAGCQSRAQARAPRSEPPPPKRWGANVPLDPPPGLLSARDAAKYLGISPGTLWTRSTPRGPLPTVRIGTRLLYARKDLDAAIERMKS
jgi:hypothetical protein